MATEEKRTVKLGKLRRIKGIAKGKAVRSLRNVRRVPKGTDTRQTNKIGATKGVFSGRAQRLALLKGGGAPDLFGKLPGSARRINRALLGALTSPYRFRRTGNVGSRQG